MKKRIIAGLLAFCIMVTLLPVSASAANNTVSPALWDDVQGAIDNASPGDTIDLSGLAMKNPVPKEDFTSRPHFVVDKDLSITAGDAGWSRNISDISRCQYMNIELKNDATLTLYSILIEGGQDGTPTIYGKGNVVLGGVADAAKNTEIDGYGSCWTAGEKNSPAIHVSGNVMVGEKARIRGGCSVLWRYYFTSPPVADDTTAQPAIISDNGTVTIDGGRVMGGGVVATGRGTLVGGAGIVAPTVVVNSGYVDGGSGTDAGGAAIIADKVTLYTGEIAGGNGLDAATSTAGAAIEATDSVKTIGAERKALTVKGGYAVPECAPAIDCDGDVTIDGGTIQGGTYGIAEAMSGSAIKVGTGAVTLSGDAWISQATGNTKTCRPVIESKGDISIAEGVYVRNGGSGRHNDNPHEPSGSLIVTTGTVTMTGGQLEMFPFSNADENGSAIVGAEKFIMTGGKIGTSDNIKYNGDATLGAAAIKDVKTVEIGGNAQITGFLSRSRFSSNTDYKAAPAGPAISGAETVIVSGSAVVTGGCEIQYNAYTSLLTAIKSGGDAIENCKNVTVKENAVVTGGAHTISYMNYSRAGDGIFGADVVHIEDQAAVYGGAAVKDSASGGKGGNGISNCGSITLEEGVTVSGGSAEYMNYGGMGIKMNGSIDAVLIARGKISGGSNGAAIGNVHGTVFVDGSDKAGAAISSNQSTIQMADSGLTILRNGTITAGGKAFTGGRYYKDVVRDYAVAEGSDSDANQLFALELAEPLNTAAVAPEADVTITAPDGIQYTLYDDGNVMTLTAADIIGAVTAEYHRATNPAGGEYISEAEPAAVLGLTVSGNTASFTMPADDLRLGTAAPTTYTLTYDGNGNDYGFAPAPVTNITQTQVAGKGDLSKAMYEFAGWNTAVDGNGTHYNVGDTITLDRDITLYAEWTELFDVSFYHHEDNFPTPGDPAVGYINGNDDFAYVFIAANRTPGDVIGTSHPTVAPKPGYVFDGWYEWLQDNDGNRYYGEKVADIESVVINSDLDFAARFVAESAPTTYAKVTFQVVNGKWSDGTSSDKTVDVILVNGTGTLASVDVPAGMQANKGYTGGAWDVTPNTEQDAVTGDVVYTYSFTKKSGGGAVYYTLTYETNGGSAIESESYAPDTTVKLDKTPSREGYTFTGWYADGELKNKISEIKMEESKTVYAGWKATGVPDELNGKDHFAYIVGREDGLIHPQSNITRAEVATIFYRLLKEDVRKEYESTVNSFSDVKEGQWHNTAISTIAKMGIVKGRGNGKYEPDAPITRAEFAAIAARFDGGTYSGTDKFPDISGHWAAASINLAAESGWVQGDNNGKFRPNASITRAEAMTLINRVLQRLPESTKDLLPGMKTFPDNQNTSAWYYLPVQEAANGHDYERKTDSIYEKWTALTK